MISDKEAWFRLCNMCSIDRLILCNPLKQLVASNIVVIVIILNIRIQ